jgi:hypothetical protein
VIQRVGIGFEGIRLCSRAARSITHRLRLCATTAFLFIVKQGRAHQLSPADASTGPNDNNFLTVKPDICLPAIRMETDRTGFASPWMGRSIEPSNRCHHHLEGGRKFRGTAESISLDLRMAEVLRPAEFPHRRRIDSNQTPP